MNFLERIDIRIVLVLVAVTILALLVALYVLVIGMISGPAKRPQTAALRNGPLTIVPELPTATLEANAAIALNDAPKLPTVTTKATLTPSRTPITMNEYLTNVGLLVRTLNTTTQALEPLFNQELIKDGFIDDPRERASIELSLENMQQYIEEFRLVYSIPSKASRLHDLLVVASKDCEMMVPYVQEVLDNQDVELMRQGQELLMSCSSGVQEASAELEELLK